MTDSEIVALFWARDESAVQAAMSKYSSYCRTVAGNILTNPQDILECLNDTWMAAWNSIPPHRPAMLSAYLGKLARRISLKKWRDAHAQKRGGGEAALALDELSECIVGSQDVESALERRQLAGILDSFLATLPETERRVFLRRYWYLDSISQVAKHFGFSESKVKSMLHRARQKLKKRLIEEGVFE